MRFVIDVILLVIIALCTWSGFKKGVIGGVASLIAIIIALFGGTLLSSAYSGEVIPALEPFVDGYVNSADTREDILDKLGYGSSDLSLRDILDNDPSLRYDYAFECMKTLGLHDLRADELATKAVNLADRESLEMPQAVVDVQCDAITYVGALVIAFLLILIAIVAVANLFNLSMRIPNMETLDEVGGAALGFAKGFIYCVLLCWVLSFIGIAIGRHTVDQTLLARFFLAFDFITAGLM